MSEQKYLRPSQVATMIKITTRKLLNLDYNRKLKPAKTKGGHEDIGDICSPISLPCAQNNPRNEEKKLATVEYQQDHKKKESVNI